MKTEIIQKLETSKFKKTPKFGVGDTIAVNLIVREGDKKRNQLFSGIVIAIKNSGIRKTFTIRKISAGIGVEKIIPLNSPNIESIKMLKKGDVRKAKLYYMRKRIGKRALKVNEGVMEVEAETEVEVIEELPENTESDDSKVETEKAK
jgi:large subunit ribosomal protein L19